MFYSSSFKLNILGVVNVNNNNNDNHTQDDIYSAVYTAPAICEGLQARNESFKLYKQYCSSPHLSLNRVVQVMYGMPCSNSKFL